MEEQGDLIYYILKELIQKIVVINFWYLRSEYYTKILQISSKFSRPVDEFGSNIAGKSTYDCYVTEKPNGPRPINILRINFLGKNKILAKEKKCLNE